MIWIIIISIGVFTGWLAGVAIGGGGGFLMNICIGVLGSAIGYFLGGLLINGTAVHPEGISVHSIFFEVAGAAILMFLLRLWGVFR